MLCSNSFSPYFHPIFSPLLEKGIKKWRKLQFPYQNSRGHLKMEVGKEGQKQTPNSMHQCSPLFRNDCKWTGTFRDYIPSSKYTWIGFHSVIQQLKERIAPATDIYLQLVRFSFLHILFQLLGLRLQFQWQEYQQCQTCIRYSKKEKC